MRRNQKDYKPQAFLFRKSRKRIEILFYSLYYATNLCFEGIMPSRPMDTKPDYYPKKMALTVIQLINKLNNRNINNLKICIT